ncbi:peritrophin-48-like, partial [Lucilia sericata]
MVKNLHFMLVPILWAFVPITKINAEYEVSKYCQLVPVGTKLPSLESCQTFYTCLGQKQVAESKCAGDDVFDKDLQMCVPRTNNNCHVNIENPCENQDDTWVGDTKDCSLWHYCSSGKLIGSGSCALGQYFDDTIKSCVNGKCPYNMETSGEINDLCQIMQKDQFFGDFQDCAVWHRCNGSGMNKGKCEHGLLYDTQKRMCLKDSDQLCEHNGGKLPLVTQGLE